jgi:hypothetical protein
MRHPIRLLAIGLIFAAVACGNGSPRAASDRPSLEGGWRTRVTFTSGPLKGRPYQFLITYSAGGGMTASSNFDRNPPAYGSWGQIRGSNFKNTYMFWTANAANPAAPGGTFSGSGVLTEDITLSEEGDSYTSRISYQLYDARDQPLSGQSGNGTVNASRIIVG